MLCGKDDVYCDQSSCFHLGTGDGFLLLDYFELSTVTASDVGGQIVYSMKMALGR